MLAAPIPANETERLSDLRAMNLLDTPPEERFDRIVRLTSRVFDVPMAFISLVDSDRQWFKAKCGVSVNQTARDVSFCAHAINQDEPTVVLDALEDDRFRDNPLVTGEPHIRFYAGCPIAGPNGTNVGTLCMADRRPRNFDTPQLLTLRELAALAEQQLNLMDHIRAQQELIETKDQLVKAQSRIAEELTEAAAYVRSLLPAPVDDPIRVRWKYISSSQLGGDFFGYHWLDDHQMVIYLLDVCGHGVGASLLSISVHNALRRETLPHTRFDEPAEVLAALNRAFPMEEHNNKFFTIWYGVYDTRTRRLRYAAGGHHPAVLLNGPKTAPLMLGSPNFLIGMLPDASYTTESATIPSGGRLYVFSDGTFEFTQPNGRMMDLASFVEMLSQLPVNDSERLDQLLEKTREMQGATGFNDDFSLVELEFPTTPPRA